MWHDYIGSVYPPCDFKHYGVVCIYTSIKKLLYYFVKIFALLGKINKVWGVYMIKKKEYFVCEKDEKEYIWGNMREKKKW